MYCLWKRGKIKMNYPLDKRLKHVKIENIINLILTLEGFGLGRIDFDLVQERLHNLGFVYKGENRKHGKTSETIFETQEERIARKS